MEMSTKNVKDAMMDSRDVRIGYSTARLFRKDELDYHKGMFMVKDTHEIVLPAPKVIHQANKLEELVCARRERFIEQNRRKLNEVIESFHKTNVVADTPLLDRLISEIQMEKRARDIEFDINRISELIDWVKADTMICYGLQMFVSPDDPTKITRMFHLDTLGNPLEWTADTIYEAIAPEFAYDEEEDNLVMKKDFDSHPCDDCNECDECRYYDDYVPDYEELDAMTPQQYYDDYYEEVENDEPEQEEGNGGGD